MGRIATVLSTTAVVAVAVMFSALPASATPTTSDPAPSAASTESAPPAANATKPCAGGTTVFVDGNDLNNWTFGDGDGGGKFKFTSHGLKLTVDGGQKVYGYMPYTMTNDNWCEPTMKVSGAAASSVGVNLFPTPAPASNTDPAAIISMPSFDGNWMSANDYNVGLQAKPPWTAESYAPLSRYFSKNEDLTLKSVGFSLGTAPAGSAPQSAYLESINIGDTTYQFANVDVTPTEPTFTDAQCGLDGVVTIPQQDGVTYQVDGKPVTGTVNVPAGKTVTVTATAADHYTVQGTASWDFTASTLDSCPAIVPPCQPTTTVTVTPTNLNGWTLSADKSGSYTFTPDGLTLSADAGGKVLAEVALPEPLTAGNNACEPSLAYSETQAGGPNDELSTLLLPTASTPESDAIYHEEPSVYDQPGYEQWWSNAQDGVKSGMGYQSLDTLGDYLDAGNSFTTGGFVLGRLSPDQTHTEVQVSSITLGNTKYVFSSDTSVTPQAPTFTDSNTPGGDTVTIPTETGVIYTNAADGSTLTGTVKVADGSTLTVKAQAAPGYAVTGTSTWSFTGTAPAAAAGGTGGLPNTGATGIGATLALGLLAAAAGVALVLRRRRQASTR